MMQMLRFTARTVTGAGRGKRIGTPTVNLELKDIPAELVHGIYACTVGMASNEKSNSQFLIPNSRSFPAVMHYGPRPVFDDSVACEVHLLDQYFSDTPPEIAVTVVARIRDVENFSDVDALKVKIAEDIAIARDILSTDDLPSQAPHRSA